MPRSVGRSLAYVGKLVGPAVATRWFHEGLFEAEASGSHMSTLHSLSQKL